MSYPAAKADSRVGVVAFSDSFLISSGGCDEVVSFGTAGESGPGTIAEGDMVVAVVLGRFASGELGREGGTWSDCSVFGGGVATLVITAGSC
jgi:hypothetical protein